MWATLAATICCATAGGAERPAIRPYFIPFGERRRQEMRAYARRHYGIDDFRLRRPRVIGQHVAVAGTARAVFNTFAHDRPDPELRELPNVCSHFVVDGTGRIHQLVSMSLMCRHTVGLNHTSIGIEHTGFRDGDVLGNRRQLDASIRLTTWVRCRFGIGVRNVIGHNESLSSPYHRERVARLRTQTHGDMTRASMRRYRARLRATRCS